MIASEVTDTDIATLQTDLLEGRLGERLDPNGTTEAPYLKSRTNARLTRLACIALFKWAAGAERKYVPFNACQNLPKLKKSKPREHYLSPDEIKLLWYALDRPDVPFNREEVLGVKFMLCTMLRQAEFLAAITTEIESISKYLARWSTTACPPR
jgi:integrase